MHKEIDQKGNLLIPLIIAVVLAVSFAGFGVWAFLGYSDFKNNTDQKIEVAVAEANKTLEQELEADFVEREKTPTRKFISNSESSSIELDYPKTWSVYSIDNRTGSKPLDTTFHPRIVYAEDTLYALRILVDESDFERFIRPYETDVAEGTVKMTPITVAGVRGARYDGQIDRNYKGSLVVFPVRDKTIQIWTESEAYIKDFNKVLKNLTFDP